MVFALDTAIPSLILVGLLWGLTNPLIKRGVIHVRNKQSTPFTGIQPLDSLITHCSTPSFIIPQLLNFLGSFLFAISLPRGNLSVAVPLANGVSLAANAIADHFLGEGIPLWPGIPGVALILLGVTLCSSVVV